MALVVLSVGEQRWTRAEGRFTVLAGAEVTEVAATAVVPRRVLAALAIPVVEVRQMLRIPSTDLSAALAKRLSEVNSSRRQRSL